MPRKSSRQLWSDHLAKGKVGSTSASERARLEHRESFRGRLLGIDPSLRGTGLALLSFDRGLQVFLDHSETLKLSTRYSQTECLGRISAMVRTLIETWEPDAVAIEETIYVQNFRTAQILGAARGAAIGTASAAGRPVFEYSPLRIKQAVVGYGRASKEQVAAQLQGLLKLKSVLSFDESDAAAVAYCHAIAVGSPRLAPTVSAK